MVRLHSSPTVHRLFGFACLALVLTLPAVAEVTPTERSLVSVETKTMAWVDNQILLAEDEANAGPGVPLRFAEALPVSFKPESTGIWELLEDGSWMWRLRIMSPGALHLNFGFSRYSMPAGGHLMIYPANDRADFVGPYGAEDNKPHGQLWTPLIPGSDVVLEVRLPSSQRGNLDLELTHVNHGYRTFGEVEDPDKSGACNVDVVCPEGDGWREQIRSVAAISVNGSRFCTGFMVNNTNNDRTPYFMTANHCDTQLFPESLVFYWNYVSSTCRELDSEESGTPTLENLDEFTNGSTLLATGANSDYTLLLLDDMPPESVNVFWAGWDAQPVNADSVVAIHHPRGHAKRISFDNDITSITPYLDDPNREDGTHLRVLEWDLGTTEGGSSGSPLFNEEGRVIGQLHGGFAACGNEESDWYGRFSVSYPNLKTWLDPNDTGALRLNGVEQTGQGDGTVGNGGEACDMVVTPTPCVSDADTICILNDRFSVEVDFSTADDPSTQIGQAVTEVTADDSGLFYFFGEDNWEFLVKMVNGCSLNDHFWLFAAATTNLQYTLRVTDTENGCVNNYFNPLGVAAPAITDTFAFLTCP